MSLAGFLDVAVHDDFAVHGDGDVVALHADFLLAPLAQRLVLDALGGNHAIDGAVHLILAQTGIDGVVVVEDLHLAHAVVGSIHAHRGADAHAVVHARTQEAELEAEDEVAILLLRVQVALVAIVGRHVDAAVDGHVAHLVAHEVVEVRAVEEELEALLLLFVGENVGLNRRQLGKLLAQLVHGIAVVGVARCLEDADALLQVGLYGIVLDVLARLGDDVLGSRGSVVGQCLVVELACSEQEGIAGRRLAQVGEDGLLVVGVLSQAESLAELCRTAVHALLLAAHQADVAHQGVLVPLLCSGKQGLRSLVVA